MKKLEKQFYAQNAVDLAVSLLGKTLVRVFDDGNVVRYKITTTEAYSGKEDKACMPAKAVRPERK